MVLPSSPLVCLSLGSGPAVLNQYLKSVACVSQRYSSHDPEGLEMVELRKHTSSFGRNRNTVTDKRQNLGHEHSPFTPEPALFPLF